MDAAGASGGSSDASASSASIPGSMGGSDAGGGSSSGAPAREPAEGNGAAARPKSEAGDSDAPEEPKWHREKTKIKRGGQERELSVKEALAMLSDDFEDEVVVSKEPRKVKYQDLVRGYQKSGGAEQLMRQAAEQRAKLDEQIAYGKQKPEWVLENVLDVPDHREWAKQIVVAMINEERELGELLEANPSAYHTRMHERAKADLDRKGAFEAARSQREQQARAQQESQRGQREKALGLLKAAGLPTTDSALGHVAAVMRKYSELRYDGTLEEAVAEAKQSFHGEVFGWLDALSDEQLLETLGKDRRKRLRELELSKVNGKPAPKVGEGGEREPRPRTQDKQITEAQFRERFSR